MVVVVLEGAEVVGEVVVVPGDIVVEVDGDDEREVAGEALGTAVVVVVDDPAAPRELPEDTAA